METKDKLVMYWMGRVLLVVQLIDGETGKDISFWLRQHITNEEIEKSEVLTYELSRPVASMLYTIIVLGLKKIGIPGMACDPRINEEEESD